MGLAVAGWERGGRAASSVELPDLFAIKAKASAACGSVSGEINVKTIVTRGAYNLATAVAVAWLCPGTASALEAVSGQPPSIMGDGAEGAQAAEPVADGDAIVVTGSRIERTDLTSTSPIITLTRDEILLDRALDIETLLTELPQSTGSFGATSNGADARGAATLDLRGLGQNRTLVLLNGTRAVPFGFRNSVDVNSIPAPLIERVEVLTGGASAVYGADAVAGVVNFILRDDFRGVEASAVYNVSEQGDAQNYGLNVTAGANFAGGRGNLTGYVGWSRREGLFKGARDFASPEINDAGTFTGRSPGGNFTRSDGASVFDFGGMLGPRFAFDPEGGLTPIAQTGEFGALESLVQPAERLSGALFFNFRPSDAIELYGRAIAVRLDTQDQLTPVNVSTSFLVQRDNPFITPAMQSVLGGAFDLTREGAIGGNAAFLATVSRAFPELGIRGFDTARTSMQGQIGARGDVTRNISWDVYAQYGRTKDDIIVLGEGILARLRQAANATVNAQGEAVCVDPSNGCVPANVFGPGAIGPAAAAFIAAPLGQGRKRDQFVSAAALTGDTGDVLTLPAGAIDFALGVEYREEKGSVYFDEAINRGEAFNQGTRPNFGGSFNVKEAFGEVRVPILAGLPFVERLEVEAAYRLSDYSTAGRVDAYKLGGSLGFNPSLRLRGAYQTVVRAPNIGELFGAPGSLALAGVIDPCANPATSGASVEVCSATGAPLAPYAQDLTGALFLFGGNPDLEPEKGRTYTVGTVLTPAFLPGFAMTADHYDIRIDNAIGAVLPQATLDTCYVVVRDASDPFCSRISRGATGQLKAVDSSDVNVALLRVKGIDVGTRYGFALGGGRRLTLDYAGDIVISQTQKNGAAAATTECAGRFGATCGLETRRALPRYRHRFSAGVSDGNSALRGTWRMLGAVEDDSPTLFAVERIGSQHYFDLAASHRVTDVLTLVIGVDNLFDRRPPLAGTNAADANTFPASYDVIGRRFGVSVTVRR